MDYQWVPPLFKWPQFSYNGDLGLMQPGSLAYSTGLYKRHTREVVRVCVHVLRSMFINLSSLEKEMDKKMQQSK